MGVALQAAGPWEGALVEADDESGWPALQSCADRLRVCVLDLPPEPPDPLAPGQAAGQAAAAADAFGRLGPYKLVSKGGTRRAGSPKQCPSWPPATTRDAFSKVLRLCHPLRTA